jgi:signal transduction histidine kinase
VDGRPDAGLSDTGRMLGTVNWIARALGFAWVGVLAFVIVPPHRPLVLAVQVAGYCLLGTAMLAWAFIESHPAGLRRRAWALPVILGVMAAAAGFASAGGSGGSAIVAFGFVAALIAGGECSLAAGLAVTAAGILAIEISGLAFHASSATLLGLPLGVTAGLIIGRNRGAYRVQAEQSAMLLAQREQLRTEQRRADLLDERSRIAREIHDVLAHSLGALGIQIQAARAVLTDRGDVDRAVEMLATAQRMAAEGLVETRRAVHALRTDTAPLDAELAQASDTHAQRYGVAASFNTGGTPRPLPPEATITLLRVAQESLVNAAKHATGQPVAVRLDYGDADVRLTIRNGLTPTACADSRTRVTTVDGGYGLTGMRERLRLMNGTLEAGRRDNQWVVSAALPGSQSESVAS